MVHCLRIFCMGMLSLVLSSGLCAAEGYPERPVQMIIPVAPGGGSDLVVRVIEKDFRQEFGQPLSFVYKPGASGAVGVSELKTLPPDGYTLCSQSYPHMIIQELSGSGNYAIGDFDFLGMVAVDDIFFAVRNTSPFQTIEEFIARAKAEPGTLTIGTTDTMGCAHMAGLKFKMLGVPVNIVNYAAGSKAVAGLLGRQVDAVMAVKGSARPSLNKMRLLAICGQRRDAEFPDVPTFRDLGLDIIQFNGRLLLAPKGLPAAVKERLVTGLRAIYSRPDVVERNRKAGFEVRFADGDAVLGMFEAFRPEAEQLIRFAESLK